MAMTWGKRRAIVITLVVLFLVVLVWLAARPARISRKSVLLVDASGVIEEQRPVSFFTALNGQSQPVLHDFIDAIDASARDSRITGLVVRVGPLQSGWGKLQELHAH